MSEQKKLKYLFIVEFADGSSYMQTPEDKSAIEPETRNCYYDVLQSGKTIRRFSIVSQEGEKHTLTVDLGSGIFYHNGFALLLESDKLPTLPDKFNLIWYHQVTRDQMMTFAKKSGEVIKTEDMPEFREYFIGWQCVINGKNYQQKIGVA